MMSQKSPLAGEQVSKEKVGFWTYFWGFLFVLVLGIVVSFFRWRGKVHIKGTENLRELPWQNVLFASNHPSMMIEVFMLIPVLAGWRGLFNPRRIAWQVPDRGNFKSLTWLTFGSFKALRLIPVDRDKDGKRSDIKVLLKLLRTLPISRILLFPEGGRSANQVELLRTASGTVIGEPKEGAGELITLSNPIIVPILVKGAELVMPIGSSIFDAFWNIWRNEIWVIVGERFECKQIAASTKEEKSARRRWYINTVMKAVAALDRAASRVKPTGIKALISEIVGWPLAAVGGLIVLVVIAFVAVLLCAIFLWSFGIRWPARRVMRFRT